MRIFKDRYTREAIEVVCPKCKNTKIIYIPDENIPKCDYCNIEMVVREILTEGKY